MRHDPEGLATVATVRSETEGQLIANSLIENGIEAVISGGASAEFRAEAPGSVVVQVKRSSLKSAQTVLRDLDDHSAVSVEPAEDYDSKMGLFGRRVIAIGSLVMIVATGLSVAAGGSLIYSTVWGVIAAFLLVGALSRWTAPKPRCYTN